MALVAAAVTTDRGELRPGWLAAFSVVFCLLERNGVYVHHRGERHSFTLSELAAGAARAGRRSW